MSRNIAVTGASRGIGKVLVELFASHGHRVFALTRNPSGLNEIKGERIVPICLDLEDAGSIKDAVARIGKETEALDVLVNNAGYLIKGSATALSAEEIDRSFRINAGGALLLSAALKTHLERGHIKHVVNISSMGGVQGSAKFPGLSVYSASKGAVSILTECLAEEWKDSGVRVNALALGAVQTEMLAQAFPGYKADLQPKDMAVYIAQFALEAWKYYNGKVLPVSSSTP
ncbi:MAG: SDR family oxidoreductase [Flavobacteriales bacterium]|nr:SDR family oxidoreductase [Flavobacteriales bacterium]